MNKNKCLYDKDTNLLIKNQSGQSFIEFVLLLGSMVIISFTFMKFVNTNTANRWLEISQVILDDKEQTLEIR